MAEQIAKMQIFDDSIRQQRRARARKRNELNGLSFLLERCLDDVSDRLLDINRHFQNVLIVGNFDLRDLLNKRLPLDRKIQNFTHIYNAHQISKIIEESSKEFDLVLSLLDLQSENALPNIIGQLGQCLKPDGLFIASILGGETLGELRQVFYKVDQSVFGGLTPRVIPMITHSQAGQLISHAGLKMPVVDVDRFTVNYSALERLVSDIRDLGEANSLTERSKKYLGKIYFKQLKREYAALYADQKKVRVKFEILWLTGWAPHKDQPKPLKPGSAKMRLADALNVKESKL